MGKGLKGITVKIDGDNRNLVKVMSNTEKEARSLSGELKGVNSLLKFDPKNTELLAQKQTVLTQAIGHTESKLKMLVEAQRQMSAEGKNADNSAEYRDLQREIAATQQKLAGYNTQLKNTQNAQRQAAKEAETLGQKIYKIAGHIPIVNKLADGFVKAKQKITETVKESETVKKIGSAVADAKQKIEDFKDAHPAIKKVSDVFHNVKEKADELRESLPSLRDGLEKIGTAASTMGKAAGTAATGLLKAGAAATGTLAAGFGYTIKLADEAKGALNDFSASTGITGGTLKEFDGVMKEIYADNFGENMKDVAESMALVSKNSRLIDPAETKKVTEYALALRDTFGYDIQEQMRAANMLVDQFGGTYDEAFNLIAQGAQSGWLDKNGDMLDSINEYSVHFKQLGLDAESMFNSLANGAYTGTFSVDKCGDAIKEFGIRVKDGTADDSFKALGLSVDRTKKAFNEGGASAKKAMQEVTDALFAMKDPVEQNALGVQMFGTMWEDLGAEGIQAITDVTGEFDKSYDVMQEINDIKYDTFGEAMQGVGRIIKTNFITPIGEEALPLFTDFAKELSKGAMEAEGDVSKMGEAAAGAADALVSGLDGMIQKIMQTLVPFIAEIAASIVSNVPALTETILPPLINGFITLMKAVTATFPTLLPQILNAAIILFSGMLLGLNETVPQITAMLPEVIQTISQTITDNLPQLVTAGTQILVNLISGITQTIPILIETAIGLLPVAVQAIMSNLPLIIDAGLNLLLALANGITQAIPQLASMLPQIIDTIISQLVSMLPRIIETGIQLLNALVSGIIQAIPQLIAALPQIIASTANTIIANLPKIIQTGIELLGALISGIIQAIPSLVAALPQVFSAIINAFRSVNWADLGKNIIDGVIQGVKNAADSLINVFKDLAKQALDAVKDFFKIKSPSRRMRDEVGKMLPTGMAEGVEDAMPDAEKRIRTAMARGVPTTIDGYIKSGGNSHGGENVADGTGNGGFVQNLTINSPRELSPSETARLNRITLRQTVLKLKPT